MHAQPIDPVLGELRERVGRLEKRTTYLERVAVRLTSRTPSDLRFFPVQSTTGSGAAS